MKSFIRAGASLIVVVVILFSLSSFALAQPIDYGQYENIITYNAVVNGDEAAVSNINGNAGDTIEILIPLSLDGMTFARIYITLKGPVTNGSITINSLTSYSGNQPGDAIAFFNVETSGFDQSSISSVDFIFQAPSNYNNVQLNRRVNGSWVSLSTASLGQEGDIVWYKGTSPGFSDFAITGVVGKKAKTGGKLPFTSGMPLYVAGGVGLLLIASGIALRLKVR